MTQKRESPAPQRTETGPNNSAGTAQPNCNSAAKLLPRLDRVRQTGSDSWVARCPAHDDRTPSLSIRQAEDRLLLHCFAGCPIDDVLSAVGLCMSDLFDRPLMRHGKPLSHPQRRRYGQAQEALKVLSHEALIVMLAADRMTAGLKLERVDIDRLHDARDRIQRAYATAGEALPEIPNACPELKRPSDFREELHAEFFKERRS